MPTNTSWLTLPSLRNLPRTRGTWCVGTAMPWGCKIRKLLLDAGITMLICVYNYLSQIANYVWCCRYGVSSLCNPSGVATSYMCTQQLGCPPHDTPMVAESLNDTLPAALVSLAGARWYLLSSTSVTSKENIPSLHSEA